MKEKLMELNDTNSQYCERMKVRGTTLNCGYHIQCWSPDKCIYVPKNAKPPDNKINFVSGHSVCILHPFKIKK